MSRSLLLRNVRVVSPVLSEVAEPSDLRVSEGHFTHIAPRLSPDQGELVIDGGGRWVIPGLWDQHVHMGQWAQMTARIDLTDTASAADVLERVQHVITEATQPDYPSARVLVGQGFRISRWAHTPASGALDAVTGEYSVVLISGDVHCGWLNTRALNFFGLDGPDRILDENEWFALYARLSELTDDSASRPDQYRVAIAAAHARGIVGITDFEYTKNYELWPQLVEHSVGKLRVNAAFYPDALDDVVKRGLKTGDQLAPLITMGPLKIIADGSLSTLTAYCCDAYGAEGEQTYGIKNYAQDELRDMLSAAATHGLTVAFHAIGDAAVHDALDAFASTGARGSIEHAQLMRRDDLARMASLGLSASVQPAHLIDDYDVAHKVWSDRADRCYLFRSMQLAGIQLALGSDAPVSPLNPWLAIDAAVNRAEGSQEPWNEAEQLSPADALFASTNGSGPIGVGSRADLVLLDDDPLRVSPRAVRTALTMIDGEVVFDRELLAGHLR
jgi:predicted amidohydrolase YtcJ